MRMTNTEGRKISQPRITAQDSNAEYVYIIKDKEVWLIDYIIGIAFKTPIDFRTINRYGIACWNREGPILNFMISKIFKIIWKKRLTKRLIWESSIDTVAKLEKDDKRIVFHPHRKGA
jgi:hypothetical protein